MLVKAYSIHHGLNVKDFIDDYMRLLNNVLNDVWHTVEWRERGKRLIPFIRKDGAFRKELRGKFIRDWVYCKHYVDSAIKQVYSVLESRRIR